MKALVLKQYHEFEITDVEDPTPQDDEVLIRIKSVGICGSDVYGMTGASGRRVPPIIMGHEASGEIVAAGKEVMNWNVGDRVTFDSTVFPKDDWFTQKGLYNLSDGRQVLGVSCDDYRRHGAFAEYLVVPQHILVSIPEGVSFNHAALVEPAAVALHGINLSGVGASDTALVVGTGIIGLFVVQLLRWKGCREIIAIDLADEKLAKAKEIGATTLINPKEDGVEEKIAALTEGRGVDHAFEVVGIDATFRTAVKNTRKGGAVTLLGNISKEVTLPLQDVVTRQIRLQGSCGICGEYPQVLDLMATKAIDPDAIISTVAPLADGIDLFQRLHNREEGLLKVILQP